MSSSNYGKSVDYSYILKEFPVITVDGLCLENEENGEGTEVSQLSLLRSSVNEAQFTEEEETGGRTDFSILGEGKEENFKLHLSMFNYIMPTQ